MSPELTCIDLDQPALEGFRRFVSSWLVRDEHRTLLVDPGPLSTIPRLLSELRRQQVERLDYILLTHIHIDHAGGAGELLRHYPQAQVVCHPEGMRHLAAPEKLWQGSKQVLGRLAEVYGEIVAVPQERLRSAEDFSDGPLRAFLTPGHAQHHCCYLQGDLLFAGEVAGVRCEVPDGIFMRPATPPRFLLPVALASIEDMLALAPRRMVFAHHGLVEDAAWHLRIGREQLRLWVRGVAACRAVEPATREEAIRAWLLEHDPVYRNLTQLPQDLQARERTFLGNSLRGMMEYVESLPAAEQARLAAE